MQAHIPIKNSKWTQIHLTYRRKVPSPLRALKGININVLQRGAQKLKMFPPIDLQYNEIEVYINQKYVAIER